MGWEAFMKVRSFVLIGLSLVLGLVIVMLIHNHDLASAAPPVMAKVVTAKTQLNFGDRIEPGKLQVIDYSPQAVPAGAFSKIEDVAAPGEERVALRLMVPGEPVLASKISGKGGRATLSTVIDKGMRAVTVAVNDVKGVAGFIQVADRVDVLFTGSDHSHTDVLLQNIKVLGIDQQADADDKKEKQKSVAKAVTLEVSPQDAQKLTLASSIGSLSLALRNYGGPDEVTARTLSVSDLFPTASPEKSEMTAATPKAEPVKHSVEILRGIEATSYDVGEHGAVSSRSTSPTGMPKLPVMPRKPAKIAAHK
jgi:pilus assembly protein CpaB